MVLGGDQVYPVASPDNYRNRFEGPFFAGRPQSYDETKRIPVYALPGNHDWYDGLTSFIRLFCHKDRWVGQWTATQSRSYFVLKLPHHWWVWGLDVQLESDLDVPQVDYFKRCAKLLDKGDRVIIVSPEPTWIEAGRGGEETSSHRNMAYLEGLIRESKAAIPVKIAGDLHHYARYAEFGGKRQLITCGGGGAFLHGTYGLPKELHLKESQSHVVHTGHTESIERTFEQKHLAPTEVESKAMRKSVMWMLLYRNPWFAVAVGGIYWIYSWLLESASEALNTPIWTDTALLDYLRHEACGAGDLFCWNVLWAWADIVLRTPGLFVFTAVIIVGCAVFAWSFKRSGRSGPVNFGVTALGALHGVAHILLALLVIFGVAHFMFGVAHFLSALLAFFNCAHRFTPEALNWLAHALVLPGGGIPGSLLVAGYLWLSNVLFGGHDQEVLSTQAIADHKCFARFHVTKDTVTIYPIGLETVCTDWSLAEGVKLGTFEQRNFPRRRGIYRGLKVPLEAKAIFVPKQELKPRLLEGPIVVHWPKESTESP
jgi:hypothetical protein